MKLNTSTLTGPALDWAVAKAEGAQVETAGDPSELFIEWPNNFMYLSFFTPSTNWAQGGPIIDREDIIFDTWSPGVHVANIAFSETPGLAGPTKLIAAMRCFVASRLGDEVDVPEDLVV